METEIHYLTFLISGEQSFPSSLAESFHNSFLTHVLLSPAPDGILVDAMALSYLHHNHLPPPEWRVRALPERFVSMNLMPADQVNLRTALHALPPLIKGYLRLGAYIGDGAVIDQQFGTTDVFILLPVDRIAPKYQNRFSADEGLTITEYRA